MKKKENMISIVLLIISLCSFLICEKLNNETLKIILCIIGITLIIMSIIFERKADNPKVKNFGILHSIIAKSKDKVK